MNNNISEVNLNQGSPAFDGFGRLRTGVPLTLFDSKLLHDKMPLLWDEATVSGSGFTSAYLSDESAVEIASDGTEGKFVRQTFMRFNYQPGKAQSVMMTGVLDPTNTSSLEIVKRSSTNGTPVDTSISKEDFNGFEYYNNFGASVSSPNNRLYLDVDLSKTQIFTIDFEWLGVGQARIGVVRNGQPYFLHFFQNDNISDKVYMKTPNLPLRYEMEVTATETITRIGYFDDNDGLFYQSRIPKGAQTMKCICGTVISEGGQDENGIVRSVSTGATQLDANASGTLYAMIGIRLKSTHLDTVIKQISLALLSASNASYEYNLRINPTVAGTFTYSDQTNSAAQTVLGATTNTVTGGTLILAGFGAGQSNILEEIKNAIYLGSTIGGVADQIVLCIRPLSANLDIYGSLTWREL